MAVTYQALFGHLMGYGAALLLTGLAAWLACALPRQAQDLAGRPHSSAAARGLTVRAQALLVAPLVVLVCAVLGTWRGHEGTFAQGQLVLTAAALRWALFVWGCGGALWVLSGRLSARGGAFGAVEWFHAQGALLAVWAVVGFSGSLLTTLLLLEVASLLVLLMVAHSPAAAGGHASGVSGQLSLLRALLFFIWLTALAALFMFWSLTACFASVGALDLALMPLVVGLAPTSLTRTPATMFYLGLSLKLLLPPFQLVAFTLYRHLPTASLAAYLAFYYPFSLAVGFGFFWFQLFASAGVGLLASAHTAGAFALGALFLLDVGVSLRGVLAFSTVANLGILALAATALA